MVNKLLIVLMVLIIPVSQSLAQQVVKGKVTDQETGEGLPGVSILISGTSNGTVTDAQGEYQITVPNSEVELVFAFIGYVSEEVVVGTQTEINIGMVVDIQSLEEVVVIGYGTRSKKDLTGSISQIDDAIVKKATGMSPQLAMQGRLPGVLITPGGGDPTARPTVRIRGVGTWGYSEPLYVIDGIPVAEAWAESAELAGNSGLFADIRGNQNIFNTINPADIESITVLKDASASAIYGVRAANGVILITTKKGAEGKPRVTINASAGIQNIPKTFEVLNTQQFADLNLETLLNAGIDPASNDGLYRWYNPAHPDYLGNSPNQTDWQKEGINENALVQDYSIAVSGGNQSSTYYSSFGYSQQESPMLWKKSDRYSVTLNSDHKINPWFRIGENFRYSYINTDNKSIGNLTDLLTNQPWQPIYDESNFFGFAPYNESLWGPNSVANDFAQRQFEDDIFTTSRTLASAFAEFIPMEGLRIRGTLQIDLSNVDRFEDADIIADQFRQTTPNNGYYARERQAITSNIQRELLLGYNKSFGDHAIDITLNGSWQRIEEKFVQSASDNGAYDGAGILDEASSTAVSSVTESALIGFLSRISYNYSGKYYLDFSIRRDGTSRFADGYRWGTFPAVAAAWRISSEPFMAEVGFINDLKLRAGWGQLGNQVTGLYQYLSLANLAPKYLSGGNNGNANGNLALPGAYFPSLPNNVLSWETVETTNIGFDALLINNKLNITAEYYRRQTLDILQSLIIPTVAGYQASPSENIGNVLNQGIELSAQYQMSFGELGLNVGGNFTSVKNEVTQLQDGLPLTIGNTRIEEGQPIGYLYGFKTDGIFQNDGEVTSYTNNTQDTQGSNKQPGDIRFQDLFSSSTVEGEEKVAGPDGLINSLDQTYLGKTIPGYFYGFNIGATYKGFDFSIFFQGVGDVQKVNIARWDGEGMSTAGINRWTTTLDRWTPENPSQTMPRAVENDPAGNERFSDRWVEDADFLRFKNLQIGYSLPENLLKSIGWSNFRIYADASNLATFTSWTGIDPENDQIPLPRIFKLGLSASF